MLTDTQELRIGSIMEAYKNSVMPYSRVTSIFNNQNINVDNTETFFSVTGNNPCLKPLLITPENLRLLGYEVTQKSYVASIAFLSVIHGIEIEMYSGKYPCITSEIEGFDSSATLVHDIIYIHQLQNVILALKGIKI